MSGKGIAWVLLIGSVAVVGTAIVAGIRRDKEDKKEVEELRQMNRDLDGILGEIERMKTETWMELNQERVKKGMKPILKVVR